MPPRGELPALVPPPERRHADVREELLALATAPGADVLEAVVAAYRVLLRHRVSNDSAATFTKRLQPAVEVRDPRDRFLLWASLASQLAWGRLDNFEDRPEEHGLLRARLLREASGLGLDAERVSAMAAGGDYVGACLVGEEALRAKGDARAADMLLKACGPLVLSAHHAQGSLNFGLALARRGEKSRAMAVAIGVAREHVHDPAVLLLCAQVMAAAAPTDSVAGRFRDHLRSNYVLDPAAKALLDDLDAGAHAVETEQSERETDGASVPGR